MIRLVAVIDTTRVSGPARQLAAICAPLAALGIEQHIIALQPEHNPKSALTEFLDDQCVPFSVVAISGRLRWRSLRAIDNALQQLSPDILQTHSYRPNAHLLLLRAAKRATMPWIAFHHGVTAEDWRARGYHAADRVMMRYSDQVIVVAESQRTHVTRARQVCVIPNVVLQQQPRTAIRSVNWRASDNHAPLVLYVGRLSYEKGVDVLLDAWPAVKAEHPRAMLRVVGDGPARRLLEMHPSAKADTASVTFVGNANPPWDHFAEASVVVLPSRSEGTPNVLLEAIGLDRPVVATNVGGIAAALGSPPAGLLVPSEKPAALARGVCDVLSGEHEALHSGERARVRETSSVVQRAGALAEVYHRLHARAARLAR